MPEYYYCYGEDELNFYPPKGEGSFLFGVGLEHTPDGEVEGALSAPESCQPYSILGSGVAKELVGDDDYEDLPSRNIVFGFRSLKPPREILLTEFEAKRIDTKIVIEEYPRAVWPGSRGANRSKPQEIVFYAVEHEYVPEYYIGISRSWLIHIDRLDYLKKFCLIARNKSTFCDEARPISMGLTDG